MVYKSIPKQSFEQIWPDTQGKIAKHSGQGHMKQVEQEPRKMIT
jgi:hypothetical protein